MLNRIIGLLTHPAQEWTTIAGEETDIGFLYSGHILILAAIPVLAILAGLAMAGGRYLGTAAIVTTITAAFVTYAMGLALPLAVALVLTALAPRFKSDGGTTEALKLVAYAWTPFWLAGVSYVVVQWSRLDLIGAIYAAYLFFSGVSPVMGVPVEQRVPFTLVAGITTLALSAALNWAVSLAHLPYFGF